MVFCYHAFRSHHRAVIQGFLPIGKLPLSHHNSLQDLQVQIVDTLGFGEVETYLVQAPPYVIAYIFTLVVSWSSGRMLEHCWHIIGSISICLIGASVMISTLNVGARYFSLVLLCSGPYVGLNVNHQVRSKILMLTRGRSNFRGKQQSCLGHEQKELHSLPLQTVSLQYHIGLRLTSSSPVKSLCTKLEAESLLLVPV